MHQTTHEQVNDLDTPPSRNLSKKVTQSRAHVLAIIWTTSVLYYMNIYVQAQCRLETEDEQEYSKEA